MSKPFILGINGSPHKDGTTVEFLHTILDSAQNAGAEVKIIHLYDLKIIPEPGFYSKDPKKEIPENMPSDGITELYPEIRRADGIVLATPTYWANMSAVMKSFIEHLTALENESFALQGKVAAFVSVSKENEGGVEMAAMSMVAALAQMGVLIVPNGILWYPGRWANADSEIESWATDDAPKVGHNMVKIINILKKETLDW